MAEVNNLVGIGISLEYDTSGLDSYLKGLREDAVNIKAHFKFNKSQVRRDISDALPPQLEIPVSLKINEKRFEREIKRITKGRKISLGVEINQEQLQAQLKKATAGVTVQPKASKPSSTAVSSSINFDLGGLLSGNKQNTSAIVKQIMECCDHIRQAIGDGAVLTSKSIINSQKKDQQQSLLKSLIGNVLGGIGKTIAFPLNKVLTGAFEGFGRKMQSEFGKSFLAAFKETLRIDTGKIGNEVGRSAGTAMRAELEKFFPGFVEKFNKARVAQPAAGTTAKKQEQATATQTATTIKDSDRLFAGLKISLDGLRQALLAVQTQTAGYQSQVQQITKSFVDLRLSVGLLDEILRRVATNTGTPTRRDTSKAPVNTNQSGKSGLIGKAPSVITKEDVQSQVKATLETLRKMNAGISDSSDFKKKFEELSKLLATIRATRKKIKADSKNDKFSSEVKRSLSAFNRVNSAIDKLEKEITSRLKAASRQIRALKVSQAKKSATGSKGLPAIDASAAKQASDDLAKKQQGRGGGDRLSTTGGVGGRAASATFQAVNRVAQATGAEIGQTLRETLGNIAKSPKGRELIKEGTVNAVGLSAGMAARSTGVPGAGMVTELGVSLATRKAVADIESTIDAFNHVFRDGATDGADALNKFWQSIGKSRSIARRKGVQTKREMDDDAMGFGIGNFVGDQVVPSLTDGTGIPGIGAVGAITSRTVIKAARNKLLGRKTPDEPLFPDVSDPSRLMTTGGGSQKRKGLLGRAKEFVTGVPERAKQAGQQFREGAAENVARTVGEEVATRIARALFKLLSGKQGTLKTAPAPSFKEFKKSGKLSFVEEVNTAMVGLISTIKKNTAELNKAFKSAIAAIGGRGKLATTGGEKGDPAKLRFQSIFNDVVAKSGFDPAKISDLIPSFKADPTLRTGQGAFSGASNSIDLSQGAVEGLRTGAIGDADLKAIVHEMRHGLQTAFGALSIKDIATAGEAAIPLIPGRTKQGDLSTTAFVNQRQEQGLPVSKDEIRAVSALENDADRFASKFSGDIGDSLKSLGISDVAEGARQQVETLRVFAQNVILSGGADKLFTKGNLPPAPPNPFNKNLPPAPPNPFNRSSPPVPPNPSGRNLPPVPPNPFNRNLPPAPPNPFNRSSPPVPPNPSGRNLPPAPPNPFNRNLPPAPPNPFNRKASYGASPDPWASSGAGSKGATSKSGIDEVKKEVVRAREELLSQAKSSKSKGGATSGDKDVVRATREVGKTAKGIAEEIKLDDPDSDPDIDQVIKSVRDGFNQARDFLSSQPNAFEGVGEGAGIDSDSLKESRDRIDEVNEQFGEQETEEVLDLGGAAKTAADALKLIGQTIFNWSDEVEPPSAPEAEDPKDIRNRIDDINERLGVDEETQNKARQNMQEGMEDVVDMMGGALAEPIEMLANFVTSETQRNLGGGGGSRPGMVDENSPFVQEMIQQNRENMGAERDQDPGDMDNNAFTNMNLMEGLAEDTRQLVAEGLGFGMSAALLNFPRTTLTSLFVPIMAAFTPFIAVVGLATKVLKPFVQTLSESLKIMIPIRTRFESIAGDKKGGAQLQGFAEGVSSSLQIDLDTASDQFSKFVAAAKGTKLEGQGIKDLFFAMSRGIKALGLNAQDSFLVMQGFLQIVSKNRITMEELRLQIAERFPSAMGIFQRAMGAASMGEFEKMVSEGISGDIGLIKVTEQLNLEFKEAGAVAAKNYLSGLQRIENAQKKFVRRIAEKVEAPFAAVTNAVGATFEAVTQNAEKAFVAFATVIAGLFAQVLAGGIFLTTMKSFDIMGQQLTLLQFAMKGVIPVAKNFYTALTPFAVGIFADLVDDFAQLVTGLEVTSAFEQIVDAIKNVILFVKKSIGAVTDFARTTYSGFKNVIASSAELMMVFEGIKDTITVIMTPLLGLFELMRRGFAASAQVASLFFAVIQTIAISEFVWKPLKQGWIYTKKLALGYVQTAKAGGVFKTTLTTLKAGLSDTRLLVGAVTTAFLMFFASAKFSNDYNDAIAKSVEQTSLLKAEIENLPTRKDIEIFITRTEVGEGSESGQNKLEREIGKQKQFGRKGFDLTLGLGGILGIEGGFRTDDLIIEINKGTAALNEFYESMGKEVNPENFEALRTEGQRQFEQSRIEGLERNIDLDKSLMNSGLYSRGESGGLAIFDTEVGAALERARTFDKQIGILQERRAARLNKNQNAEVGDIDDELKVLLDQRSAAARAAAEFREGFLRTRKTIEDSIKSTKESQDLPDFAKEELIEIDEQALASLDDAIARLDEFGISGVLSPLVKQFEEVKTRVKEAKKEIDQFNEARSAALAQEKAALVNNFASKGSDEKELQEALEDIEIADLENQVENVRKFLSARQQALTDLYEIPVSAQADTYLEDLENTQSEVYKLQEELAGAEESLGNKRIATRKRVEQEILDAFNERVEDERRKLAKLAETEKQELLKGQIAGDITKEAAAEVTLQNTIQETTRQLASKRSELNEILNLRSSDISLLDDSLAKEEEIRAEIDQLNTQQLDNELSRIEQTKQAEIEAIGRVAELRAKSVDGIASSIERQKSLINQYIAFIENQVSTLQSRLDLRSAGSDLEVTKLETRNQKLQEAIGLQQTLSDKTGDVAERQKAADRLKSIGFGRGDSEEKLQREIDRNNKEIAKEKRDALIAEQRANEKLLDLENKRKKAAAETAVIEAEIVKLKAQQSLLASIDEKRRADIEGDPTKIRSAELGVQIAAKQLAIAENGIEGATSKLELTDTLASDALKKQDLEQAKGRVEFNAANEGVLLNGELLDEGSASSRKRKSSGFESSFVGNIPAGLGLVESLAQYQLSNISMPQEREIDPANLIIDGKVGSLIDQTSNLIQQFSKLSGGSKTSGDIIVEAINITLSGNEVTDGDRAVFEKARDGAYEGLIDALKKYGGN